MLDDAGPSTRLSLLLGVRDPTDSVAWGGFVTSYGPLVVRWCKACGLKEPDAQDVSQVILCKLVREMQKFEYDAKGSFRKWLRTVTNNAVRDFWRNNKRRLAVGTGDSNVDEILQNVEDSTDGLIEQLVEQAEQDLLRDAEAVVRSKVSPQTWAGYSARKNGEPAREIAQKLNMKLAAVHKAKSRVTQMLRYELKRMLDSEE